MFQQALHAGGAELAAHRAGRVLERLDAVEDEQGAFAGDGVGEQAAFVPRRERRLALHAEPFEGVGEEGVFGGLPVFLGALAVEAPRIDAPRAEPALALEALEPVLDEHGLAHAAPRDERDDGGVRLGEGEVEEGEFLFAADEFFLAQAGAAGERELVEVDVVGCRRLVRLRQLGKRDAAEFFGDVGGELAEDAVLCGFGELRERIGLIRCLSRPQPIVGFPVARFADDREHRQLVTLLALAEKRELRLEDVLGFERLRGKQHNRKSSAAHGLLDVVVPEGADADSAVLPDVEQVMLLKDTKMPEQQCLPLRAVAPVAVADENAVSLVHGFLAVDSLRHLRSPNVLPVSRARDNRSPFQAAAYSSGAGGGCSGPLDGPS